MIGERLPEDHSLALDAGWNLVSYLPHGSLPVAQALANIDGLYTAVLGFENGAVSYYPDLDATYNTLEWMRPDRGYWIKMQQAATLQYSVTHGLTTGEYSPTVVVPARLKLQPGASGAATEELTSPSLDVQPTNTWVNFYGPAEGSDGQALPVGTVVEAVDPEGVTCGGVTVTVEGQYGLLPCYGDDPTTTADEGAEAGDTIAIVVGGQVVGEGIWTGHGERQLVPLGGAAPVWYRLYLPVVVRVGAPERSAAVPQSLAIPGATPTPIATLPTSPLVTPQPTGKSEAERVTPPATPDR